MKLAARLATAAEWGTIWVSRELTTDFRGSYDVALPREQVSLKEFDQRLEVFALAAARGAEPDCHSPSEMGGRADELQALEAAAAPLFAGSFGGWFESGGRREWARAP